MKVTQLLVVDGSRHITPITDLVVSLSLDRDGEG